jgi:hypothetical protein
MQSCKNIIENYEIYLNDTSKNDFYSLHLLRMSTEYLISVALPKVLSENDSWCFPLKQHKLFPLPNRQMLTTIYEARK